MKREYRITILDSRGLWQRLAGEVSFVANQMKVKWAEVRRDPVCFAKHVSHEWSASLHRLLLAPYAVIGTATAVLLVLFAVLTVLIADRGSRSKRPASNDENAAWEQTVLLSILQPEPPQAEPGIGSGSRGRVAFEQGKGEGSNPEPKKSGGGGSGGLHDQSPPQQGRIPQPSEIPAPIPKLSAPRNPELPLAGIDIDPLLWKELPFPKYGDPRSNATGPSNGPGEGGGMGTVNGQGIGDGNGPGVGKGEGGNIGGGPKSIGNRGRGGSTGGSPFDLNRVLTVPEVTQRARVISKPEPQYTEEARKNQITGTVVLRVVFSKTGEVTNIRAIASLPFGLTEKAIAAARQIRFAPALKEGIPVSVYMQLEYSFNLY